MVDVSDDAEIPNLRRRGEGLVGETADGNLLVWACSRALERYVQGICAGSPGPSWTHCHPATRVYAANMASGGKSQWKTFQRFAENLVFNGAPRLARHVQNSQTVLRELQQAVKITANVIAAAAPQQSPAITAGRPVTSASFPTAQRARKLVYAPNLDGRADPGEIVWTWVAYEDDPS